MPAAKLFPFLIVLVLASVYVVTLLPGPGHSGDTAEFQLAGYLLGTTHPTGNPGYLLLNHLFTWLFPAGSVAYRANLLSAVFSIGAGLLLYRILLRLQVPAECALAAALAFGLTPTWWRYSVVAEVYTLNLLFVNAVFLVFLRWHQERRDRDFYLACALYALSFGNHLSMVTLLPALLYLVWVTDRRVFLDGRRILAVAGIIVVSAGQYLYPLWRSRTPSTPYLARSTPDLASLWTYMTGQGYEAGMFQAPVWTVLSKRLPAFVAAWGLEWWPLLPLAVLGVLCWKGRVAGGFLLLTALATLTFALNYDIADIDAYYIPVHWVTAVAVAIGLAVIHRRIRPASVRMAALALLPLALGLMQWKRVEREKGPEAAVRVEEFLQAVERGTAPPALVLAGYHEYEYFLYFILVERRGQNLVHPELNASMEEVRRYLVEGSPIYQRQLRRWIPPGLTVYCTKGLREREFREAGLVTQRVGWGLFEVRVAAAARPSPEGEGFRPPPSGSP